MTLHSLPQQNPPFNPQSASVPLYVAGRSKPVAWLRGTILHKGIEPRHILNKPRAIAFDAALIDEAQHRGARTVQVACEGTTYTVSLDHFLRYCFPLNRGFGRQLALEVGRWSINGATPELDRREQVQAARDSQMDLFALVGGAA